MTMTIRAKALDYQGTHIPCPKSHAHIIALADDGNIVLSAKDESNYRVMYGLSSHDFDNIHDALIEFTDSVTHSGAHRDFSSVTIGATKT